MTVTPAIFPVFPVADITSFCAANQTLHLSMDGSLLLQFSGSTPVTKFYDLATGNIGTFSPPLYTQSLWYNWTPFIIRHGNFIDYLSGFGNVPGIGNHPIMSHSFWTGNNINYTNTIQTPVSPLVGGQGAMQFPCVQFGAFAMFQNIGAIAINQTFPVPPVPASVEFAPYHGSEIVLCICDQSQVSGSFNFTTNYVLVTGVSPPTLRVIAANGALQPLQAPIEVSQVNEFPGLITDLTPQYCIDNSLGPFTALNVDQNYTYQKLGTNLIITAVGGEGAGSQLSPTTGRILRTGSFPVNFDINFGGRYITPVFPTTFNLNSVQYTLGGTPNVRTMSVVNGTLYLTATYATPAPGATVLFAAGLILSQFLTTPTLNWKRSLTYGIGAFMLDQYGNISFNKNQE